MINMLSQILDVISTIVQGVVSLITSTLQLVLVIPQFLAFILGLIAVAPPFMSAFLIAGVTASILFLLLGRN